MRHYPYNPKMLERINFILKQIAFRIPRKIETIVRDSQGYSLFICPSCNMPIGRDYQEFCSSCGQHIDWSDIEFAD